MAIINFGFKKEDAPAGAENIREGEYGATKLWLWDTYVGLCFREREMNGYDDSDFYMLVWDAERGEPREILFASTRGWSYPSYGSKADATPEVLAAYGAWAEAQRVQQAEWDREARAREIRTGRRVEVFKGRKVAKGTVGECFWIGDGRYGVRVGIKNAQGEVFWTAASNVRVILEAER